MKRQYNTRMHDGIGYSKNGDIAWSRGERPRSAPDFHHSVETCKHHIEVPDSSQPSGYRRVFAMFYKESERSDDTTKSRIAFAVVSKNGTMIRIVDTLLQAQQSGAKMVSFGASYIVPVKVVPDGQKIGIEYNENNTTFYMDANGWKKFNDMLDSPPRPFPGFKKFMEAHNVFDNQETENGK